MTLNKDRIAVSLREFKSVAPDSAMQEVTAMIMNENGLSGTPGYESWTEEKGRLELF